jgi:hypothetical protein
MQWNRERDRTSIWYRLTLLSGTHPGGQFHLPLSSKTVDTFDVLNDDNGTSRLRWRLMSITRKRFV